VSEVAAFFAWAGAALIVLSDGRRGLALGLGLITPGFAVLALAAGESLAAVAILLGGAFAAVQRLRTGPDVWGLMPSGSTSRLLLSIAGGLLALWIATSVMTGPGAPLRFAVLSVLGLMGARVMSGGQSAPLVTALAALALSFAMAAGLADIGPGPSPYIVAALFAVGVSVVGLEQANGA
jgi:hypothetical protein